MAPRNGLAPLGAINQNVQRTVNSPYTKNGTTNLVTMPVQLTSQQQQQQGHGEEGDPFTNSTIVYAANWKKDRFAKYHADENGAPQQTTTAISRPAPTVPHTNEYYQKLFADTNIDDLFASRSRSRSAKQQLPTAHQTVPMVVAANTAPAFSILVKNGKYNAVDGGLSQQTQLSFTQNSTQMSEPSSTLSGGTATTFNTSFSHSQNSLAQMHPAARARQASRSVAIADDQPAVIVGKSNKTSNANYNIGRGAQRQQLQQGPITSSGLGGGNLFTPQQLTRTSTKQTAHPTTAVTSLAPLPMHNSLFASDANPNTPRNARGTKNTSNQGSCVKVGGSFVPATSVSRSREGSLSNTRTAHTNKSHGANRPAAAQKRPRSRSQSQQNRFDTHNEEEVGAMAVTSQHLRHVRIPSDGSQCFPSFLMTGAFSLPPEMRMVSTNNNDAQSVTSSQNSGKLSKKASIEAAEDEYGSPLIHVGFTVKPLWSLVGTFKTGLCHLVDLRGGRSMRWIQRNPKGGHQQLVIPLNLIVLNSISVVRVEAPTATEAEPTERQRGSSRSRSRSGAHGSGGAVSHSRASSSSRGGAAGGASTSSLTPSFSMVQGNHTLPSYLRGKGGDRALTANTSTSSWAVIIRTMDMKPSQVTFGFGSAIEAQSFKAKVIELAKNLQKFM